MKPVVLITTGDPGGIGPEVTVKALRHPAVRACCRPVIVGDRGCLRRWGRVPEWAGVLGLDGGSRCRPGRVRAENGRVSFGAVELAVRLLSSGRGSALVTSPISKQAWRLARVPFIGHTEYLRHACGSREVAMVMAAGRMRAVLLTRHVPLRRVPGMIRFSSVLGAVRLFSAELGRWLGKRPSLGLCSLNPHAGEGGMLGAEEREILVPAARRLRSEGVLLSGPWPSDTAWRLHHENLLDGLAVLYHDQAMIPLKVLNPRRIVNWTVGLPFVRTSPGHGTAFDVAGKGIADPQPMVEAIVLAARLAAKG